jgi:hypothetical protein
VENYFNYFTEIEEHFQRRRGGMLLLSTLDWGLIETWKDAGIPLEAVLRGIDAAFEGYATRRRKTRKVNSLAYCAQAVLTAAQDMKEAAVGASPPAGPRETAKGLETSEIVAFLRRNAEQLEAAKWPAAKGVCGQVLARETADTLRELAADLNHGPGSRLEDLERRLTVVEEKLLAVLLAATPDPEMVTLKAEADRELAPYRRKMPPAQVEQLQKQYVHKRLLEKHGLPRLSLFYL